MKNIIILFLAVFICGCATKASVVKLDNPVVGTARSDKYISVFDHIPEGDKSSTVGEELFRIYRYAVAGQNSVNFNAPTTRRFPESAVWSGTHKYNDGKSGDLVIYTTPAYCRGTVGVILDDHGDLATNKPVIQVSGRKEGRRWSMQGQGKFFSPSKKISNANKELVDYWMLRYGGLRKGTYLFELCSKGESDLIKVDKVINVYEKNFLEGFAVNGIFIRGIKKDENGVIVYRIVDQRGEVVPPEFLDAKPDTEKRSLESRQRRAQPQEKQPDASEPKVETNFNEEDPDTVGSDVVIPIG